MTKSGRRGIAVLAAATVALVALLGGVVWVVGSGIRAATGVIEHALPDAAVAEAGERLAADAEAFASAIRREAVDSAPTAAEIEATAALWGVAVGTIDSTPTATRVWAVSVEREVSSEGVTDDVWACFSITVDHPGSSAARAEVTWPDEGGCVGSEVPQALDYAARSLDHRDALARYGRQLVPPSAPPNGTIVDGLRIVATHVDGSAVTVDAVDEAGTIVVGPPDSYLYGLRLMAQPDLASDPPVAAVRLPVELDDATRAQAETDSLRLIDRVWSVGSADGLLRLDSVPGRLVSVIRSEATRDRLTLHVVVEVVAGGWGARIADPAAPAALVCYAIVFTGQDTAAVPAAIEAELCGYPLVQDPTPRSALRGNSEN